MCHMLIFVKVKITIFEIFSTHFLNFKKIYTNPSQSILDKNSPIGIGL